MTLARRIANSVSSTSCEEGVRVWRGRERLTGLATWVLDLTVTLVVGGFSFAEFRVFRVTAVEEFFPLAGAMLKDSKQISKFK